MNSIRVRRHNLTLLPDSARVIIRPFISSRSKRVTNIIGRVLALSEEEVDRQLEAVRHEFASRHIDLDSLLLANYDKVSANIDSGRRLSHNSQILIGALFSGEYALESAALFNPSI